MRAIDHHEDGEARPHPRREQAIERDVEAGLLLRLATGGLLGRLVVLDEPAGQRPVAIARPVVQTDEQHGAVALDDRVRADLHVHEIGEAAGRAGRAITPVDAREDQLRAVAWTERERARRHLGLRQTILEVVDRGHRRRIGAVQQGDVERHVVREVGHLQDLGEQRATL